MSTSSSSATAVAVSHVLRQRLAAFAAATTTLSSRSSSTVASLCWSRTGMGPRTMHSSLAFSTFAASPFHGSTSHFSFISLPSSFSSIHHDDGRHFNGVNNLLHRCRAVPSHQPRRNFSTANGNHDPPPQDVVMVSIDEALSKTATALGQIGWDEADATLQAEIMVAAELCGNNQGLVKMYQPALMAPASNSGKPTLERETPTSAVVNANQAPGMLAAVTAADKAVDLLEKNKGHAISIVSSYSSSTSSGQLAFYVERMAKKGYIGLAMANSPEMVAAAPGGSPVFGTNPLAVGVPTSSGTPLTFDMATSAIAMFGVLTAKAQGVPLPDGVAYDRDGNMTTDAVTVLEKGGALATFGGHKGAGLSLCVELLAGVLSGGAVLGQVPSKKEAKSWGHTFIAIQPNLLVDDYESKVTSVLDTVRSSGPGIRIPGERSAKTALERTAAGEMPIPTKIWESIVHTAQHGLEPAKTV